MISDYFQRPVFIHWRRAFNILCCSLSETSFTNWMRGRTNFRYCWRRSNVASCIIQTRLFSQPCQKCSTASIQLRFISKQDSMSLRLSWRGVSEETALLLGLFLSHGPTLQSSVYILWHKNFELHQNFCQVESFSRRELLPALSKESSFQGTIMCV